MTWTVLVSSAVIAALVSGVVSFLTSERALASKNILEERKNWRDEIRKLAAEVQEALISSEANKNKLPELRARLMLHLNPHDAEDQAIIDLLAAGDSGRSDEFSRRAALLLKHDWERAKRETNLWLLLFTATPERVKFKDYRPGDSHTYTRWRW